MVLVAAMLASWPDCGLMPVEALNTAYQSAINSILPLMPRPDLRQVVRRNDESRVIPVAVDQRFAFVVIAVFR